MQHSSLVHTNSKGSMLFQFWHLAVLFLQSFTSVFRIKIHGTHLLLSFSEVYLVPDDDDELYIDIRVQHKTLQLNLTQEITLKT